MRYNFFDDVSAGFNLLHFSGHGSGTILSAIASTQPFKGSALELEGGTSSGDRGSDRGLALHLRGSIPWLSYDLRAVDAGPRFGGYYRDVRFASFNIVGSAGREMHLELSGNTQRRNLLSDTLVGGAPRSGFIQVGGGYGNLAGVSLRSSILRDTLTSTPIERRENVV